MTYKTEELLEQAIKAASKGLIFIEDIVAYMDCSKPTFYEHKINESVKLNNIIYKNKTYIKQRLREKMLDSDNPTMVLALYRLCSTAEEHRLLNQTYTDHTSNGETVKPVINFLPSEELKKDGK